MNDCLPSLFKASTLYLQDWFEHCPLAHRVYGPCFVFQYANPRVCGYVCPSGTGRRSDTARRASGDSTASSLISWTLFPYIYGRITPLVKQKQLRAPASSGAVRAVFLRLYAKERRDHDARNRGFVLASCSRGLVFLRGTPQAQRAEDWCSQRGTLQTQMPNEATDRLAPSVLDPFSGAARAASNEFPPASEKDSRQETPGPDSHLAPEAWCSRKGTLQAQRAEDWCSHKGTLRTHKRPTRLPTGWHRRFLPFFGRSLSGFSRCFVNERRKTRGEKPRVRIRVVLPRPGVPGRGHCRPKFPHGF